MLNFGKRDQAAPYIVFFTVLIAALVFAWYTRLAWDDWYITYRASKNLALGNGLTFTPGERIHSFTSPLGTLIPALLSMAIGNSSDDAVLWLFRVFNAIMLGFAATLLWSFGRRAKMTTLALVVMIAVAFLESKVLANTIDGMETAILLFFLSLTLYCLTLPRQLSSTLLLGVAWAGLMWTRPDGFIYVIGPCAGFFLFLPFSSPESREWPERVAMLKQWALAAVVAIVLYAPWVLWAWRYYGTPIPHTITAKGLQESSRLFGNGIRGFFVLGAMFRRFLIGDTVAAMSVFMPPYAVTFGGWPHWILLLSRAVAWGAAFAWACPLVPLGRVTRAISFTAFVALLYLTLGMEYAFPWYFAPVTALSAMVIALILSRAFTALDHSRAGSRTVVWAEAALAATPIAAVVAVTLIAAVQLKAVQALTYDHNYRQIGLYLRDHAAGPHDTVFLEPLGYIGFFSNLKMYDYPGLSSDEMLAARRKFPITNLGDREIFANLIPYMRPDWLVLRPREIDLIDKKDPTILDAQYKPVERFDVTPQIDQMILPGKPWLRLDQTFVIFHRNDGTSAESRSPQR